jgi:hypothetical protein
MKLIIELYHILIINIINIMNLAQKYLYFYTYMNNRIKIKSIEES